MASKGGRVPESHEPGEFHFHYKREDREAMLSDETKRVLKKSKLFSMNRRNMIILADIVVIVLFTMIFAPLVLGGRNNARFDGFRASVRAYEYDGSILISLKVEASEDNAQESNLVSAQFSVEDSEYVSDEVDLLPSLVDTPRVLRAEFPADGRDRYKAVVDVEINGIKHTLSTTVKKE